MTLKIIGAGLGRTGTKTLQTALIELGFGPCHHMTEVFHLPEQAAFWLRASQGEVVDWEEIFAPYLACVDWPAAYFYQQLADRYPDAKVILSRRDPQLWYNSMSETILKRLSQNVATSHQNPNDPRRFIEYIIARDTFGYDLSQANVIAAFERHNAQVISNISAERLLVFTPAQGWEPLCRFLGIDIPDTPFPRTNSREEFWQVLAAANPQ